APAPPRLRDIHGCRGRQFLPSLPDGEPPDRATGPRGGAGALADLCLLLHGACRRHHRVPAEKPSAECGCGMDARTRTPIVRRRPVLLLSVVLRRAATQHVAPATFRISDQGLWSHLMDAGDLSEIRKFVERILADR